MPLNPFKTSNRKHKVVQNLQSRRFLLVKAQVRDNFSFLLYSISFAGRVVHTFLVKSRPHLQQGSRYLSLLGRKTQPAQRLMFWREFFVYRRIFYNANSGLHRLYPHWGEDKRRRYIGEKLVMCLIQILQDKYTKFRTQTRVARVWRLWAYATRIWLYTVYIVYLCIWLYTVRNSLNPYLERSDLVEVLQWACTWAYRSAQLVVPVIRWKATFAGELFLCLSWCMGTLLLSVVARNPDFSLCYSAVGQTTWTGFWVLFGHQKHCSTVQCAANEVVKKLQINEQFIILWNHARWVVLWGKPTLLASSSVTWHGLDPMILAQHWALQLPEPGCEPPCTILPSFQSSLAHSNSISAFLPFLEPQCDLLPTHRTGTPSLPGAPKDFLPGHSALKEQRQFCIPMLMAFCSWSPSTNTKNLRKWWQLPNGVDFGVY